MRFIQFNSMLVNIYIYNVCNKVSLIPSKIKTVSYMNNSLSYMNVSWNSRENKLSLFSKVAIESKTVAKIKDYICLK